MSNSSPVLGTDNLAFVELLYSRYVEDPNSVPEDFRRYFESEHPGNGSVRLGPSFAARSLFDPTGSASIHVSVPRSANVASPATVAAPANGAAANGASHDVKNGARSASAKSSNGHSANGVHENGGRQA